MNSFKTLLKISVTIVTAPIAVITVWPDIAYDIRLKMGWEPYPTEEDRARMERIGVWPMPPRPPRVEEN